MKVLVQMTQEGGKRNYPLVSYTIELSKDVKRPVHKSEFSLDADQLADKVKASLARFYGYVWSMQFFKKGWRALEIGVDRGDGIARLLDAGASHVVGVDPFMSCEGDYWYGDAQEVMERRYSDVMFRFKDDPVTIIRKTSDEYFKRCTDIFDWVYIDGDHHREPTYRDLKNARNCTRNGGFILLDDVDCSKWSIDIRSALSSFREDHGDSIEVLWEATSPAVMRAK